MDDRKYVIILSDIHIGTNAPTVWYRKDIHEKYLITIFRNIIAQADQIREVILLGDIFEFWAYTPDVLPPSFDEIIEANSNILGPNGMLSIALSALKGRIMYIPGNHDINLREEDIKKIKNSDGYFIQYHQGAYIPSYDRDIILSHGNEYTLFNAPYEDSILAPLPIGHFLSRAIAYQVNKEIGNRTDCTVAHFKKHGNPSVIDYFSKIPELFRNYVSGSDYVSKFIDFVSYMTGMPQNYPIRVNEEFTITLDDVKIIYKDLLSEYLKTMPKQGLFDHNIILNAIASDFNGRYVSWFAQKLAIEKNTNFVVTGHTHIPVSSLNNSFIQYINTGYMCPSIPDFPKEPITFGIYDLTKKQLQLNKMTYEYPNTIQIYNEPVSDISTIGGSNHSSYITIDNQRENVINPLTPVSFYSSINDNTVPVPNIVPSYGYPKCFYFPLENLIQANIYNSTKKHLKKQNENSKIPHRNGQPMNFNNFSYKKDISVDIIKNLPNIKTEILEIEIINNSNNKNENYTIGWSVYNSEYEFFMAMQDGVLSKAKEYGYTVLSHNQRSDPVEMIKGCNELINRKVNILIISPVNPEGVPIIVANAKKSNIPVIVIDQGTGGADVFAFIVSDSFGGGVLAGEYALKLIKKHSITSKNVVIIKVEKTAIYALRRGQAFKSVMTESGYTVVAEVTANGVTSEAYRLMKIILETYADNLAVVFGENDRMALGAAQAIEEAGKKGEIMVIGFDGEPAAITAIKDGLMQGTIAQQPFKMGEIGVQIAHTILAGGFINYDDWTKREVLMDVYLIDDTGEPSTAII